MPGWLLASLVGAAGVDAFLVYQVPIMVDGGLPLGAAAFVAGLRGFAQLGDVFNWGVCSHG